MQLTVGKLRKALDGKPDDMPVYVEFEGIVSEYHFTQQGKAEDLVLERHGKLLISGSSVGVWEMKPGEGF